MDAAQRVRQRIKDWLAKEGHGSQKRLADAVSSRYGQPKAPTWVTGIISGPQNRGQDLRLADLDDVADCLGMQPGDLVRRHDRNYLELTTVETRLVQYYRALPETIRHGWIAWLDHMFKTHPPPQPGPAKKDRAHVHDSGRRARRSHIRLSDHHRER